MSSEIESGPFVEIALGRRSFYVPLAKIQKFPESYFCVALKPHWNNNEYLKSEDNVEEYKLLVDRDVRLFRFIAMYLELGCIPRDKDGDCLIDPTLFAALREEADYFCLSALVAELDILLVPAELARYIGMKMDSECRGSSDSIVLGTGLDYSQPIDSLKSTMQHSYYGFYSACTLHINRTYDLFVDSNVVISNSLLERNYETLLSVYDSSGRAKLSVCDRVSREIKSACSKNLKIPESRHKVKVQQLIVRTSSKEFFINNTEDISDDTIVAYALVSQCNQTLKVHYKGGEIKVDFVPEYRSTQSICAMKSVKYKLNPVLEGVQYILKFAIVQEDCSIVGICPGLGTQPFGPQRSIQESRQLSLEHLLHYIEQHGAIGVYSSCSYLTASKFSPETLLEGSYDKALYEFATSRGIPLSMVYVRSCVRLQNVQNVQYVPQPHDMLLNCHKQNKNICFVASHYDCPVYFTATRVYVRARDSKEFITSAFIVG